MEEYKRVNSSMRFIRRTVNHSENSINPQDGTYTQVIKSFWIKFKKQIKKTKVGNKL